MALTADIGNARDIHPVNKWTVGERLALFALRDLYGFAGTVAEGPRLRRAIPAGGELSLEFDHVHGALQAIGDQIDQFEVAGEDGVYVPAVARLSEDGQGVILSSPAVEAPVHARYLWNDAGYASIMGGAGLPMAPFRTR
jgi:sialate O-acetylesterase